MADKVHSSFGRKFRSREMAALHGFAIVDVVIPSTTRLVEDSEGTLATGALNAFNYVSATGLDVTIDTGEAVIDGAYLATDDQHTVTVTDNTTTTIYVGWKDGQADTIIVGVSGAFTSDDLKTAIWDITASSGSVTGQTDQRNTDSFRVANSAVEALRNLASGEAFTAWPIESGDIATDAVGSTELIQEEVEDLVGAMAGTNLTYDDPGGVINAASAPVDSVFGRTGAVTAQSGDYSHSQLSSVSSDQHHAQDHGSRHHDGGADEIDAANLAAALGSAKQVLQSDGLAASWVTLAHGDLGGIGASDHHAKYTDAEALAAIEAGNLDHVQGINGFRIDFDHASYIEMLDSGVRTDVVLSRVYLDAGTGWFTGAHSELQGVGASDHHAKYTEAEAQEAALIWAEGFAPGFAGPFNIGT